MPKPRDGERYLLAVSTVGEGSLRHSYIIYGESRDNNRKSG
ncbi:hypothetical protein HSB1_28650 [Halogranum salarium B-1]|uniref:Uncharacterized protein n=1 Tax=Halogranum salarium B-1 TaxID=1210908 RepID=J3JEY7_9EURY|nr:hypothetical protein HSB1_28650 [Halogranum salarium B-1]